MTNNYMPKRQLKVGGMLVEAGVITPQQLEEALALQKTSQEKLGKILVQSGYVDNKTFLKYFAENLQIPLIDLTQYKVQPEVTVKLREHYARRFQAILLEENEDSVVVGLVDPLDIFATDELARILGKPLKLALVDENDLHRTLDLIYRRTTEITGLAAQLDTEMQEALAQGDEADKETDTAVSRLVQSMFEDAVQVGASDIHIEPAENVLRIRLRVDGVLQEQTIATEETRIAHAISQRLKLMAGLNITEKRLPQDGGFQSTIRGTTLDVRLSTMPTQYGESIVMRLLSKTGSSFSLNGVGMPEPMLERLRQLIRIPYGLILVTGPTGSGKTTTLYGALAEINDVAKNIITIEDPVEYRLERVNQVQVNSALGLTFARVLRATMRQDPNIILIGEIRDQETAAIGLRAALTGHLVLATLHTNDAASTAIRLIDIGIEGYLVAATLRAALAQRLVRRICDSCRVPYQCSQHEMNFLANFLDINNLAKYNFSYGKGCTNCNGTGFHGRIGVFELLEFDGPMLDALRRTDTQSFMQLVKTNRKFPTLLANTIDLASRGITTVGEIFRVAGEEVPT